MSDKLTVIIGSDLVPTESNEILFKNLQIEMLIGKELNDILDSSDIRIFNLEAPITSSNTALKKWGPNLKISPETINGIKKLNPTILTLANNHIMDFGVEGLNDTINILEKNKIEVVGVGENIENIKSTHICNVKGITMGVYVCAEHEFSIASERTPGVVPFELTDAIDQLMKLQKVCDIVIVLYHGGKEHYRYPSPNLRMNCRNMIKYGADIVICQHSHCIGSMENYKNGTIIYGQGNFIFDDDDSEFWQTSLLIEITINKSEEKKFEIQYIPIVKKNNKIRLANDIEKTSILNAFRERSTSISDNNFVKDKYSEFSKSHIFNYLRDVSGFPKFITRIDKYLFKSFFIKRIYKSKAIAILNYIECEAHRELFIEGLKQIIYKKDKS
ncbi:CapA family protein [uncultured Fusobacterium sp.]|uniref:CapA family protein n=1 Tax=uncultured Fusobacterium sp. TaxID=159267 RepID=UPI002590DDFD|nr:CapA family protein [uncultured Fusobacterium sp.]